MSDPERAFLRKVLIVLAVAAAAALVWTLRYVVLLLFNAMLMALFLRALYSPLTRLGLDRRLALGIVVIVLVIVVGAGAVFFGWRIEQQVSEALLLLPQALKDLSQSLKGGPIGGWLMTHLSHMNLESALPRLPGYALTVTQAVADLLLVIFGGLFVAAHPNAYRRGFLALAPRRMQERLEPFFEEVGGLLRKWLIAQLIAMVTVGLLIGVGLMVIGIPSAAALGLFAAAAEFVPIAGPIASAIPALLLASLHGLDKTAWTLVLFVVVQQFESNLLIPLLHRRIVSLSPLLVLFSLMAFEVLFGFLGIMLAIPLTILIKTALERFYLEPRRPASG